MADLDLFLLPFGRPRPRLTGGEGTAGGRRISGFGISISGAQRGNGDDGDILALFSLRRCLWLILGCVELLAFVDSVVLRGRGHGLGGDGG